MPFEFRILIEKTEMLPLWPLLQQLNDKVTETYLNEMLDDMIQHGYRMAGIWEHGHCLGVSGIWVTTKLYSGKYLEMDNVVVAAEARSRGIGKLLTDFVTNLAREEGCNMMMLDAYLENEKAHLFYEREGFVKKGYHFLKQL
ncbi:MAG: GNAT family N-acetyltransferase [Saprospiraceae bacterium]|nr:GNAT family N-acetyltransferase [Saprospiraceae bacterium]